MPFDTSSEFCDLHYRPLQLNIIGLLCSIYKYMHCSTSSCPAIPLPACVIETKWWSACGLIPDQLVSASSIYSIRWKIWWVHHSTSSTSANATAEFCYTRTISTTFKCSSVYLWSCSWQFPVLSLVGVAISFLCLTYRGIASHIWGVDHSLNPPTQLISQLLFDKQLVTPINLEHMHSPILLIR